jgi:ribonuclease E
MGSTMLFVLTNESKVMKKEMLINVLQPEESRIAIVEDGSLEELYVERSSAENYVGNIYKGKVVNIEPSIQAAFIEFGVGRNGFLHVSDVEFQYFKHLMKDGRKDGSDDDDDRPQRGGGPPKRLNERNARNKPPIQEIFQRGSEVLVQVIKEGIGNKGPTLSTYISIPGRYIVLMPGLARVGISRKINDERARRQLRQAMRNIRPPEGLGFIVRTAGIDRDEVDLKRDLNYLLRLWETIVGKIKEKTGPVDIYEESDMMIRTMRDIYTGEIDAVWIDEDSAYERAREFMKIVMPAHVDRVRRFNKPEPLFGYYGIEDEIAQIQDRHVPLDGGGSLVIDQTEALVAIDVNSGNFRVANDPEETAYRMNLRAAEAIARQIRLRDLGGVIVNDFIDMRDEKHRRAVERTLGKAVRRDRARTRVMRISPFGLIEMTRQRIRPSLRRSIYQDCPCCNGVGQVKTSESLTIEVMRLVMSAASNDDVAKIVIETHDRVANDLNNRKRKEIINLEDDRDVIVSIVSRSDVALEHLKVSCQDDDGRAVSMGS